MLILILASLAILDTTSIITNARLKLLQVAMFILLTPILVLSADLVTRYSLIPTSGVSS
jgi:hypothetical protein